MRTQNVIILTIFFIIGCTNNMVTENNTNITNTQKETTQGFLTTSDGYKISYKLLEKEGENDYLLLHQLNLDHTSYQILEKEQLGTSLAITFRGHGKSQGKWQEFDENDFNNMQLDAKAGLDKLGKQGGVIIIGASIGANTALNLANTDFRISKVILLSPGISYRGIDATKSAEQITKPVLIIVSEEDTYSLESSQELKKMITNSELLILENSGHGTNMLTNQKTIQKIKEFVQ